MKLYFFANHEVQKLASFMNEMCNFDWDYDKFY